MTKAKDVDYRIGPLLRLAHRKAADTVNEALEPLGIQGKHFGVLLALHGGGPASQRQLIDRVGSDKSSMVRIIDELESRGLCVRSSGSDRRAYAVRLTPAGRALFLRAERIASRVAGELYADFAPAERAELCRLLVKFIGTGAESSKQ